MTFDIRLLVIGLAAFASAGLAGSALVPVLCRRHLPDSAPLRAITLWHWRLLPGEAAIVGMVLAITSCIWFEPRAGGESTGLVLIVLAALALALVATSSARLLRWHAATERARRLWMASAESLPIAGAAIPTYAITSAFPVVAVVGVFRPVLVIARSVLDACSAEQLLAILAHEYGHVARHDNARRALLSSVPDVLAWLPVSKRLSAAWHEATEEAADDEAGRLGPNGRLHLAEALIQVARLAPAGQHALNLPASALYRGESLERRVCRLLAAPAALGHDRRRAWHRPTTTVALLATGVLALPAIHALVEAAVTRLP